MGYTQAVGILLPLVNVGLSLYGKLLDRDNNQVGTDIVTGFTEHGNGNYTLVYDDFPDEFYGTLAFYNSADDLFLASTEINPVPVADLGFMAVNSQARQRDIVIYKGTTGNFVWKRNKKEDPIDIVFTIKYDMVDPVEDALLIVSLTNGCEYINGEPSTDASLASITNDTNFVYLVLSAELTDMYTNQLGRQEYDMLQDLPSGTYTVGFGDASIILGGT